MSVLLIASTAVSLISVIIPVIVRPFLSCIFVESAAERTLRNEISQLRAEKASISPMDEFAKYARTERKLNKSVEVLKSLASSRNASSFKYRLMVTYTLHVLLGLVTAVLIWLYRSTPVIVLPEGWMYPISPLIAWPIDQDGAVSITAWLLVTRTVIKVTSSSFK